MSSDQWPDWLPADWTMQIKKTDQRTVKCYVDSQGHKCYSKPQVFDYLRKEAHENTSNANGKTLDLSMEPENGSSPGGWPVKMATRNSRKKSLVMQEEAEGVSARDVSPSEPLSYERSHDSNWLPQGWIVEVKTRKGGNSTGMRYKSENASTEPRNSQTYEATEDEKNKSKKKTESARLYSDRRVVTRTPAEGLPPGWIKELRLRNDGIKRDPFFVDPLSEYVFFSKKDALRYLEVGDVKACAMKPMRRDMNADVSLNVNLNLSGDEMASPSDPSKGINPSEMLTNGCTTDSKTNGSGTENQKPICSITDGGFSTPDASQKVSRTRSGGSFSSPKEVSDWLPDGWTVKMHYKSSGMKYKIYKESASGKKLYSKPQVLDYLANGNSNNSRKRKDNSSVVSSDLSQNPKRSSNKKENSNFEEVITTTPADGLPPGWIKEIRTKIFATHKRHDSFYIDPVSGYIFRSKLDALRFLETGDVNVCAMRQMKDKDGNEVIYKESASGKKLYSKPQVMNYLANGNSSNFRKRKDNSSVVSSDSSQNPKRSSNKKENSNFEEVITTPADGLPPGWIKEIRTKIFDPIYIDPVSGYIFHSKLDALCFLETVDVNVCGMRPKMKDKDGNEVSVRMDAVPKPVKTTREQLVEGGENSVEKHDNDVSCAGKTPARGRVLIRLVSRSNNSPTTWPAQSSKGQKGLNLETGPSSVGLTEDNRAVQEKQGSGVNLEKEPDDGHLSYDIPEKDDNWIDQCIDFAV